MEYRVSPKSTRNVDSSIGIYLYGVCQSRKISSRHSLINFRECLLAKEERRKEEA